jgi:hypothetical protein
VLDLWFEREVKPRLGGKATLLRYADDLDLLGKRPAAPLRHVEHVVGGGPAFFQEACRHRLEGIIS